MSEVFFQILSPLPLQSQRDARKLFEIWAETAPRFLPDRAGTHEPLRQEFSVESLDEVLRAWEFNFLMKREGSGSKTPIKRIHAIWSGQGPFDMDHQAQTPP